MTVVARTAPPTRLRGPLAAFAVLACATLSSPAPADKASVSEGRTLLERADAYRAPGAHFAFDALVRDPEGRSVEMGVRVRDRVNGLVLYTGPAKFAGRAILYNGKDMWAYVPGTRRALRIAPRQRVLGGVSSADVARTVFAEDYEVAAAKSTGEEVELALEATGRKAAYAAAILTVRSADARPLRVSFYATDGGLKLKTMHFESYEPVLEMLRPMRIRIVDHLDGDTETVMRYSNMRIEETPKAWFQPSYLRNLR